MATLSAQDHLQAIFDGMGAAVMLIGAQDRVLMANTSAVRCLHLESKNSLIDHRLFEIVPGAEAMLRDAPATTQQQVSLWLGGEERTLGFTSTTILNGSQRIVWFRDVTRLLDLDQRLLRAEQLAQVGEIAAKVSHEIRNPLASILMGLQTLDRQVLLSSRDNQTLHQVIDEVRSLGSTITSLLDRARLHAIAPRLLRIEPVVRDCVYSMTPSAISQGTNLRIEDGHVGSSAVMDEIAMTRVLANLVHNALDATGKGSEVVIGWWELASEEIERRFPGYGFPVVGIFVEDDGVGVRPEIRDWIFDPFMTTKKDGTGLGLSVVYDLMTDLGGAVDVSPRDPGMGARFELFMPMGERLRCWQMREQYPEMDMPCRSSDACPDGCPVLQRDAGFICWTVVSCASRLDTGEWNEDCQRCPVFQHANLSLYRASKL